MRPVSCTPGSSRTHRHPTSGDSTPHPHGANVPISRECFNTAILLGSIDDPLLPKTNCQPQVLNCTVRKVSRFAVDVPVTTQTSHHASRIITCQTCCHTLEALSPLPCLQDISESGQSRISACLCSSDLCNANTGGRQPQVVRDDPTRNQIQRQEPSRRNEIEQQSEFPPRRRESQRINEIQRQEPQRQNNFQQQDPPRRNEIQRQEPDRRNEISRQEPERRNEISRQEPPRSPSPAIPPARGSKGLQCFSCGSLLNPDARCDTFDRTDPSQVLVTNHQITDSHAELVAGADVRS